MDAPASVNDFEPEQAHPLSQWQDTPVRESIVAFVDSVTDLENSRFVPVENRVAVFDFDGTMAVEKPEFMELLVAIVPANGDRRGRGS